MVTFNISPTTAAPLSSKGENASSVNGPDVTSYDDDVDSRTVATDHEPSVKSVSSSSVSRSKSFISLEPTEQVGSGLSGRMLLFSATCTYGPGFCWAVHNNLLRQNC